MKSAEQHSRKVAWHDDQENTHLRL